MQEINFGVQNNQSKEVNDIYKKFKEYNEIATISDDIIIFEPEIDQCLYCNESLKTFYTSHLKIITTLNGELLVQEKVKICKNPNCSHYNKFKSKSMGIRRLVLPKMIHGIDIVVLIGNLFRVNHLNGPEIWRKLKNKYKISISQSQVYEFYDRYMALLAGMHENDIKYIKEKFDKQGGYILTIDGMESGDNKPLMIFRDNMSDEILLSKSIESESYENILPLLKEVIDKYGSPLAVISDMKAGIINAVKELLPNIKHQFCQRHFLNNVGKGLLKEPYKALKEEMDKKK